MFSSLSELLATHARSAPTRSAILGLGCAPLTYGGLWAQAKDMARELRTRGVGPQDRVAVVLPHGPEAAATVVAVAANAVCAPLNPGFTADEWRRYFTDLRIAALVTRADIGSASRTVAHGLGIPVVDLPLRSSGSLADAVSTSAPRSDEEAASAAADAFVLLTSGSTSRPKIVPLTHAAVCRSAHNVAATLSLTPRDRLLGVLPLFHVHGLVSGLLAALAAGSSIACTPGFDANGFVDWLTEFRPTWYTAVPAIHRAVLSVAAGHARRMRRSSLRIVRSASSTMPPDLTRGLERLFGVPVIDTFGMTEAASQIAANPVARRKAGSVGRSAGAEIAIMDRKGRRLPTGKRGEIALRGPTVTRGYDNDPAATAAAFQNGWFRTGDLGYLDRDGYLFIVGRIKDIINRGGQKVAPAEVEQVLLSHPEVVEACSFGVPHKRLGEDVAAAVVLRRDAEVSVNGLRDFVRGRLAAFKVPGLIHIVPEIPKGPAGKVKRGELAAALSTLRPQDRADSQGKSHTPRSDLEQQLAAAWMEFLDLDRIGRDDDVFTLGADSISLVQMLSRLRAWLNVDLSLKDLFEAPTVAALAARLASSEHNSSSGLPSQCKAPTDITQTRGRGPQPVSIVQEQVLRIDRELPGLPQFNRSVGYRLRGPLDVAAFADSLAEVVRRHASLRTRFAWRNGRPVARIARAISIDSFFAVEDLTAGTAIASAGAKALLFEKAELHATQASLTPFELDRAPLLRARLLRVGANDHVFFLVLHDLIVDGWSVEIVMEEISELYDARTAGRVARLPEAGFAFCDFARWQRRWADSAAAKEQLGLWKQRLRGVSPLFPVKPDGAGAMPFARAAQQSIHVSNEMVARLTALGNSRGATPFMTLLAGFKTLLLAHSGRHDICVATAMANRLRPGMDHVIGPVANTTLIRTRLDPDLPFWQALDRVRDAVLEAHAGQELPFDVLADRLAQHEGLDPASLIQVFFVLQNAFGGSLNLPAVEVRPFVPRSMRPLAAFDRAWLTLNLRRAPAGLTGMGRYNNALSARGARRWIAEYPTILAEAAADPEMSLGHLGERSAGRRDRLGRLPIPDLTPSAASFAVRGTR